MQESRDLEYFGLLGFKGCLIAIPIGIFMWIIIIGIGYETYRFFNP